VEALGHRDRLVRPDLVNLSQDRADQPPLAFILPGQRATGHPGKQSQPAAADGGGQLPGPGRLGRACGDAREFKPLRHG